MKIDIRSMHIGDEIRLRIYPRVPGERSSIGKVVYIHPHFIFFTLEYTTVNGQRLRESFIPYGDRIACSDEKEKPDKRRLAA